MVCLDLFSAAGVSPFLPTAMVSLGSEKNSPFAFFDIFILTDTFGGFSELLTAGIVDWAVSGFSASFPPFPLIHSLKSSFRVEISTRRDFAAVAYKKIRFRLVQDEFQAVPGEGVRT